MGLSCRPSEKEVEVDFWHSLLGKRHDRCRDLLRKGLFAMVYFVVSSLRCVMHSCTLAGVCIFLVCKFESIKNSFIMKIEMTVHVLLKGPHNGQIQNSISLVVR